MYVTIPHPDPTNCINFYPQQIEKLMQFAP